MLLIAISSFFGSGEKSTPKSQENITVEQYEQRVEKELTEIVKAISGDKKPKIFLSLETGIRREYAGETQDAVSEKTDDKSSEKSDDRQIKTITVKASDGSETAITVIEHMPQIRGVAIVCKGAEKSEIREKIISAVTAALDITSKRVSVTGGNT